MKLSVIIVNYNVCHFLEQCLHSVLKAIQKINAEVIVVDNNSVDHSVKLLKEKFPQVKLIENKKNTGFSVANNQAIRVSRGEYVLLLNPDTVIQEDTFEKILAFMDSHDDAGGLGVKMVDGKGNFLPESKRGLPTPAVAFYKIFGLARIFLNSKKFGAYHLTYLSKDEINKVDVLSGAFMLLRKSVLDKVGLLDEDYFMYGEDIDLSYRIQLAGYQNYYFPETTIIHYKGESTKKSSVNYVFVFYNAMKIFAKKHFSKKNAGLFIFLINLAIYLRAGLAITSRFLKQIFVPALDFLCVSGMLYLIRYIYETQYKFVYGGSLEEWMVKIAFPVYSLIWMFLVYLNGGYDKPVSLWKIIRGIVFGTGVILILYSLLPEQYRFSRAIIIFGATGTLFSYLFLRFLFHVSGWNEFRIGGHANKRIGIAGNSSEFKRVNYLLKQTSVVPEFIGFISSESGNSFDENHIGNINQINEIIQVHRLNEVIFCAKDMSSQEIIGHMLNLVSSGVDFKIAPPESLSIIGSNSVDTAGSDLYIIDFNSISKPENRRKKRLLDILLSLLLFILFPFLILFVEKKIRFILNIVSVLFGAKTWVGYSGKINSDLPVLKKSVLTPRVLYSENINGDSDIRRINLNYSKDYKILNDIKIILKGYSQLGD
ncbi:MAG: glycosyltransferase [Bacteroidota bacterium]